MVRYKPPLPAIRGLVRQAHGDQQRDLAGLGADHPRPGRRVLPGLRHGPLPRHAADPAGRQPQARRPGREGLRRHRPRELLYDYGGGSLSGRPIRAVQIGGPLGAYLPESQFDTPLDYEAFIAINAMVGHGGIVAFDDTVDMARHGALGDGVLRHRILRQVHSLPHRLHPRRGGDRPDHRRPGPRRATLALVRDLCDTMLAGSLCALGGMTPVPGAERAQSFSGRLRPARRRPPAAAAR